MFLHFQESRASAHLSWENKHHEKHHTCPGPTSTFFFWFFTCECNAIQHGIYLCSIGVTSDGCVLSQHFVHLWGGRLGRRKGLDAVKAQLSSAGLLTLSWWENQSSTIGDAMNGVTSMAGRASTAVLARSLPAGWGELSLHRGGHSWSNMPPSGSRERNMFIKESKSIQRSVRQIDEIHNLRGDKKKLCLFSSGKRTEADEALIPVQWRRWSRLFPDMYNKRAGTVNQKL